MLQARSDVPEPESAGVREGFFTISRAMVLNMAVILRAVRHDSLSAAWGKISEVALTLRGWRSWGPSPGCSIRVLNPGAVTSRAILTVSG